MEIINQISKDIISKSNEEENKLFAKFTAIQHDRHLRSINEIQNYVKRGSKILDIGCGFGQVSAYLSNSGYDVTGVDIGSYQKIWDFLTEKYGSKFLSIKEGTLPFDNEFFDAVVCFGVLEHVGEYDLSTRKEKEAIFLSEIHRILKQRGFFFVYLLPNKYSYIEFISKRMGLYYHKKKYTQREAVEVLNTQGFEIIKRYRNGILPAINIFKPLSPIFGITSKFYKPINSLDSFLSRYILVAQNFNIVCRKVI